MLQPVQIIPKQVDKAQASSEEQKDTIQNLFRADTRERALQILTKKADQWQKIGYTLWSTSGVIPIFFQEIISAYPLLTPNAQPPKAATNRVSNVLTMLQKMASDENVRMPLVNSDILQFLLPFLKIEYNKYIDSLRVATLGVIGMLVRPNIKEIADYLVHKANILPLCLGAMTLQAEPPKGIGKILSTFIVERLLLGDGLLYICNSPERLNLVVDTLGKTIPTTLPDGETCKLLRHCIRCYHNLCKCPEGKAIVCKRLPNELRKESQPENSVEQSISKALLDLYSAMA